MKTLPQLFENNRAWAAEREARDPAFFRRLSGQQAPAYLWIGCADSRVPANEIVGLDPGELFVHRNVANVVAEGDTNGLAVLHYAVEVLRVRHVIVCGHYGCGGVQAALSAGSGASTGAAGPGGGAQGGAGTAASAPAIPAVVDRWIDHVRRVRDAHSGELAAIPDEADRWRRLCELNVLAQVAHVTRTGAVHAAWAEGRDLDVHGWIYDVRDGLLQDLEVTASRP